MKKVLTLFFAALTIIFVSHAAAGEAMITVEDVKYDEGGALEVSWAIPEMDGFSGLEIYRVFDGTEGKIKASADLQGKMRDSGLDYKSAYKYKLVLLDGEKAVLGEYYSQEMVPKSSLFNMNRLIVLIALLLIAFLIIHYIRLAKKGVVFNIRKIPALESVEEAIGRATEMGKPILFVPGIMDIDDVQTVAGIIILGEVSHKTAVYDAALNVPVSRSMVMSTARETVKESYLKAGRPDAFNENMIHYLTDDQFGYVSGVDGIMMREKPAAIFMLGTFYAESLILAETGNSIGAIQIAGTAMPSQLPFFIAACDYTLIGEELYAASAYLSRKPDMLGALKGQDMAKLAIMLILIIGTILTVLFPEIGIADWFTDIG